MDDNSPKPTARLDSVAVALSGLCLLHCLALPVLVAVLPALGQFGQRHFHVQMLLVVVPVSVIAFFLGFRRHRRKIVIVLGGAGMVLLVLGGTVLHSSYGIVADRTATMLGAVILAAAHYFNNRYSRHLYQEAVLVNS